MINVLCDRTLLAAFALRANRIERQLVDEAARTLDLEIPRAFAPEWVQRHAAAIGAGVAAFALTAAAYMFGAGYLRRADSQPSSASAPQAYRAQP